MKSWAWATVGVLLGAGALVAPACSSNPAGTGGSGGGSGGGKGTAGSSSTSVSTSSLPTTTTMLTSTQGTGGTQDCGSLANQYTSLGAMCPTCLNANCCADLKSCDTGTDCFTLLQCESTCNQGAGGATTMSTCMTQCETQTPMGKTALDALNMCFGSQCNTECGGMNTSCPTNMFQYSNTQMDPNIDTCNTCIDDKCCSQFTKVTMGGTTAENAELACVNKGLNDPGCTGDGKTANQCENAKCGDSCPGPTCDSGLNTTFNCANCDGKTDANGGCCEEFEALGCGQGNNGTCTANLTAFNSCIMDKTGAACTGNAAALAAFNCETGNCAAQCGGGSGGGGQGGSGTGGSGTGGTAATGGGGAGP